MKFPNFYETLAEAHIRLQGTVIWYDGPGEQGPYYVLAITDHMGDCKFRIYMRKIGQPYQLTPDTYYPSDTLPRDHPGLGKAMDDYMTKVPKHGILRKELNSSYFNSFRPFPLGMMNAVGGEGKGPATTSLCMYLERQPNRATQQGLIKSMIYSTEVNAAMKRAPQQVNMYNFNLHCKELYDCIVGNYPDADECLSKLRDPRIQNEAVAFDRYFAFVRGPIGMMFLNYKGDTVGVLPSQDLKTVRVGRDNRYTREAISDLKLFNSIEG